MMMKEITIEIVPNKSTTYLLPIVDQQIDFEFLYLLRNTYMSHDGENGDFCVLYEWSSNVKFTAFEKRLMEHTLFTKHEDYDNYVLYRFKLTKNMEDHKILFINGKYSMFSDKNKEIINKHLLKRGITNADRIKKILNRDEKLRLEMNETLRVKIDPNNELSSKPNIKAENFSTVCKRINYKIEQFDKN